MEQKGSRTHGHGQQYVDWGDEESVREINGNKKIQLKKRKLKTGVRNPKLFNVAKVNSVVKDG